MYIIYSDNLKLAQVAQAAQQFSLYYSSVAFLERSFRSPSATHGNNATPANNDNLSSDNKSGVDVSDSELKRTLLIEAYRNVSDPDGVYGVPADLSRPPLLAQLPMAEHEGAWSKVLPVYDSLIRTRQDVVGLSSASSVSSSSSSYRKRKQAGGNTQLLSARPVSSSSFGLTSSQGIPSLIPPSSAPHHSGLAQSLVGLGYVFIYRYGNIDFVYLICFLCLISGVSVCFNTTCLIYTYLTQTLTLFSLKLTVRLLGVLVIGNSPTHFLTPPTTDPNPGYMHLFINVSTFCMTSSSGAHLSLYQ